MGPALQAVLADAAQAAAVGKVLHVTGESGVGKELVASFFHKSGPHRAGRFIPVNCAAIPPGLAERLLFGTRRGAYSSADADAEGYIQAAAGGTLFLDEVGDLDLAIQAKLLRVLETGEIMPLGASRPRAIDLQLCSATNKELQRQAAAGSFRSDLYYRIGRPDVTIPPLRARIEEIPWLIDMTVRSAVPSMTVHASFVEGCLLRTWPGNVRELLSEVRRAAHAASRQGSAVLALRHLAPRAGLELLASKDAAAADASSATSAARGTKNIDSVDKAQVEQALRAQQGNVSAAARTIGLHRNQLRRLIERYEINLQSFSTTDSPLPGPEEIE
jgi:DNA-binding NtrC family response regulator